MSAPGRSNLQIDQPVTHEEYRDLFESVIGSRVLDDLVARYCGKVFVSGGHEADRETAYRAGRRDVVEFILSRINRANGAPHTEEEGD